MKFLFFSLLFILAFPSSAQLLDFKAEWFTENGFFRAEEVAKRRIRSISIRRSDKKDGDFFKKEREVLNYSFYDDGKIKTALKFIPIANRTDTSTFYFYYNAAGNIYKRIEHQGPFRFNYYYTYMDGLMEKELKIDGNSINSDTSYIRYYKNETEVNKVSTIVMNSVQKPFKFIYKEYDLFEQLIVERTDYNRSSNYVEVHYHYQLNQLNSKNLKSFFGRSKQLDWDFLYKKGIIDLITVKKDGKTYLKYGFTFNQSGLIKAIVERNLEEKTVSIFKLEYEFRN